jgi:hypothetical protein
MRKILILCLTCTVFLIGCSLESNYYTDDSIYESDSTYDSYSEEDEYEMENPYDSDSGHSAGYDWAESTGGDCSGNSDSFNEGCEEYYNQESNY